MNYNFVQDIGIILEVVLSWPRAILLNPLSRDHNKNIGLDYAKLQGSDFSNSTLEHIILNGATLDRANLMALL